jgi:hypothetical protein
MVRNIYLCCIRGCFNRAHGITGVCIQHGRLRVR